MPAARHRRAAGRCGGGREVVEHVGQRGDVVGRSGAVATREPAEAGPAVGADDDVGCVDAAVDQTEGVQIGQGGRDGRSEAGHTGERSAPAVERLASEAGAQLGTVSRGGQPEQRHDARVARTAEALGLAVEAGDLGVGRRDLHCHRPLVVDGDLHASTHGYEQCSKGTELVKSHARS